MTTHKTPRRGAIIELEDMTPDYKIHKNLTQDVILTTQDKLRLALIEHRDVLAGKREWISAGSLALSLLSTLLLTTFQDKLGLSASTWQAMYALFFVFASVWLVKSLMSLYKNRKKREIDYLISQIKETSQRE